MEDKNLCPSCGAMTENEMEFCGKCGYDLQDECPGCKKRIRWHHKFCPKCGVNISEKEAEIDAEMERMRRIEEQKQEEAIAEKKKREEERILLEEEQRLIEERLQKEEEERAIRRREWWHKHWWKALACLVIASIGVGIPIYLNSDAYAYLQTNKLYEAGHLEEAIAAFQELGDYRDSEERILSIRYEIAESLYESGDLEEAVEAFNELGDFSTSLERSQAIRYEIAENLYEDGRLDSAASVFSELGSYRNSMNRYQSISYEHAENLYETGDLARSALIYAQIGDYRDAWDRSRSVCYEYAMHLFESGDLRGAATLFESLGTYLDSSQRYQALAWGFFRFTKEGEIITDHVTGLEWRVGRDSTTTWFTARNWVARLGDGWRMPTRNELAALYNAGVTQDNWGPFENSGNSWIWTGEVREYESNAYIYRFDYGAPSYHGQANPNDSYERVRGFAVRSPGTSDGVQISVVIESHHSQRFRKEGDVITDSVTGLQWRVGPDRNMDWYAARDWVNGLGGRWRMPTLVELTALHDDAGINSVGEWGPFDNGGWYVWSGDLWWAREGDSQASQARYYDFYTGGDSRSFFTSTLFNGHRAFAVRSQ